MKGLIQLVSHANVVVDNQTIGSISRGVVALIGIEKTDNEQSAEKLINKILNYRIFADAADKTNLSLQDIQGGLLLVPQFTLVADTSKGMRPGFSRGMAPDKSRDLFNYLVSFAKHHHAYVAQGEFGAHMQVTLCNDGPMTFMLETQLST